LKLKPIDILVKSAYALGDNELIDAVREIQDEIYPSLDKRFREYNRKDYQIGVRVTKEEYDYIKTEAELLQVSMSAVVRYMMLTAIKELEGLYKE
jgi:hypothetical protein